MPVGHHGVADWAGPPWGEQQMMYLGWPFLFFLSFFLFWAMPAACGVTATTYTTATATQDLGDLHHSSWQHWILNPLSNAKDRTYNLMVTSQIHLH